MAAEERDYVLLYVNGQRMEVRGGDVFMMLADWLRKVRGLTGTKIVCAEGDCGACTVLRAFPIPDDSSIPAFLAINSCIATVGQMDTSHIVTVEGLAIDGQPSPAQVAMTACHGSQCGFCTPGFVMALTALTEEQVGAVERKHGMNGLTGNLCRCTGYAPIIEAAVQMQPDPKFALGKRYLSRESLKDLRLAQQRPVRVTVGEDCFVAATNSADSLQKLASQTRKKIDCRILAAGTDLGVQKNKGKLVQRSFLSLHLLPSLYKIEKQQKRQVIGARVSLEQVRRCCKKIFPELSDLLNIFASPQIKNFATLVGNIANGSPIGDTLPLLLVSDCQVHTALWHGSKMKMRIIPLENFYLAYRKNALLPGELITHVSFIPPTADQCCRIYKASQRKDLDISAVSAAFLAQLEKKKGELVFGQVRVAFGGMAAVAKRAVEVEEVLVGAKVDSEILNSALGKFEKSMQPISDARATAAYRMVVAKNMFKRFWEELPR